MTHNEEQERNRERERQRRMRKWFRVLSEARVFSSPPIDESLKMGARVYHPGPFWNVMGHYVVIVASLTMGIDWSAYIGATEAHGLTSTAIELVLESGDKLSREQAVFFFPHLRKLPYRS